MQKLINLYNKEYENFYYDETTGKIYGLDDGHYYLYSSMNGDLNNIFNETNAKIDESVTAYNETVITNPIADDSLFIVSKEANNNG